MVTTDKRKAIFLLHQEGMAEREIARKLGVSRNTVQTITCANIVLLLGCAGHDR